MAEIQNLGNFIRLQRKRSGLSLSGLSAKSGVSVAYLSRIEKAQRYPSPDILRKIAKPLALDSQELFNLAGYLPSEQDKSPALEKHKLKTELDILLNRVTGDMHRIKGIIRKLNSES